MRQFYWNGDAKDDLSDDEVREVVQCGVCYLFKEDNEMVPCTSCVNETCLSCVDRIQGPIDYNYDCPFCRENLRLVPDWHEWSSDESD